MIAFALNTHTGDPSNTSATKIGQYKTDVDRCASRLLESTTSVGPSKSPLLIYPHQLHTSCPPYLIPIRSLRPQGRCLSTSMTPTLDAGEHLIKVMTVALCNGELLWPINFRVDDPKKQLVPGYDVAGIVAIDPSGSPFPAGTRVHTRTNRKRTACAAENAIRPPMESPSFPTTWTLRQPDRFL